MQVVQGKINENKLMLLNYRTTNMKKYTIYNNTKKDNTIYCIVQLFSPLFSDLDFYKKLPYDEFTLPGVIDI